MNPNESKKHPLASKTLWGAIITAAALAFPQVGLTVGPTAEALAQLCGLGLTVYGRLTASERIL